MIDPHLLSWSYPEEHPYTLSTPNIPASVASAETTTSIAHMISAWLIRQRREELAV